MKRKRVRDIRRESGKYTKSVCTIFSSYLVFHVKTFPEKQRKNFNKMRLGFRIRKSLAEIICL